MFFCLCASKRIDIILEILLSYNRRRYRNLVIFSGFLQLISFLIPLHAILDLDGYLRRVLFTAPQTIILLHH